MGACYSKAGHDASVSSRHKAPKEKNKNNNSGNLKCLRAERTEKISNGSVTSGIHSQNSGNTDEKLEVDSESCTVWSSKESECKSEIIAQNDADVVATSDSGIGSFLPPEEHSELITAISPADEETPLVHDIVWQLRTDKTKFNDERYCTCCLQAVNRTKWLHKLGECKTHFLNPETKRNSDVIIIKRGGNSQSDKKFRLSLKSADSLDWNRFLTTSLDRSQSQASEWFFDELSIHAPLAQFDSVDFLLSNTDLLSKNSPANSYIDYHSDMFQFKFDFSGLEMEEGSLMEEEEEIEADNTTVELASEAEHRHSKFSLDSENISGDLHMPALQSLDISLRDLRYCDSEASLELPSILPNLLDIQTMKLDGQDVVVMDVEGFNQIVEEISSLKQKLSQLTSVILEDGSISCRSNLSGIMSH